MQSEIAFREDEFYLCAPELKGEAPLNLNATNRHFLRQLFYKDNTKGSSLVI